MWCLDSYREHHTQKKKKKKREGEKEKHSFFDLRENIFWPLKYMFWPKLKITFSCQF